MRINKLPANRQTVFYVSVGLTICLALVGWFFSFKKSWANLNLSSKNTLTQMSEIKNGMQDIGSDLKSGLQEPVSEVTPVIGDAVEVLGEATEQRKEASNIVGEIMKENLENQYGETQENNQASAE
ncbi:MAG: hypothetical protein WC702_02410 [Patescibacteria group bacterium]|jgi:hypothetical protein